MSKERKPLIAKSTLSEKEKALETMKKNSEPTLSEKDVHRYNIEIPNTLFIEIRDFIKENGYNLKGFFLTAAKEKIKKEQGE